MKLIDTSCTPNQAYDTRLPSNAHSLRRDGDDGTNRGSGAARKAASLGRQLDQLQVELTRLQLEHDQLVVQHEIVSALVEILRWLRQRQWCGRSYELGCMADIPVEESLLLEQLRQVCVTHSA